MQDEDYWADEDQLQLGDVPGDLWLDVPLDKVPPQPEQWVDRLADGVDRLLAMGVLEKCDEFSQKASGTLTTRFVYDWRVKDHKSGKRMWMRRRRFVAREFAATKRQDTYSPATGTHTANMIPLIYLKMLQECSEAGVTAKLGAPHSYVYALGIYIYTKYIYHRNGGFVLHWTKQCTVGAMQSVHGPCAKMTRYSPC